MAAAGSSFPYRRILDDLRAEILDGSRQSGERLPSEHDLAERYGTSRPTVRRAIAGLKAEGLVVTQQGRGAFVRPEPHVRLVVTGAGYRRHRALGLPGFNAQVLEQRQVPEQRLREVGIVAAPGEVAVRLGAAEGTAVVARRRLFLVDGLPVALCDSFYPAEFAEGTALAEDRRIRGGAYRVIEDPAGPIQRRVHRSVDDLMSRMPTPREAEALRLQAGVPVIRVLRTVFDETGRPLEVQETVAAADRHEFRYEVVMSGDQ